MKMDVLLQELFQKEDAVKIGGGQNRIEKEHAKGKLTARERLGELFDKGSFFEVGLLVRHQCRNFGLQDKTLPGDGVITGYGLVNGREVFAFAQDATVMGGSLGAAHGEKICNIMDMAIKARAPIVGINDSAGARVQEGAASLSAYGRIFKKNVTASGVIPQISVIMGNCAGGAVYSPAMTDFTLMVEKTSYMFITGPKVIKTVTGEDIDMERLGGARVHAGISGNCDTYYENDSVCIEQIRRLLSFLPSNPELPAPPVPYKENVPLDEEMLNILPENRKRAFDMHEIISRIIDQNDFMEIKPHYAKNIICGFGKIDGNTVGIVANQPLFLAGTLDCNASDKAARFVRFCDCFNIPLVNFVDVPGYLPGVIHEHAGIIRHGSKMIFAYSEATVPKITIIIRKAYGGAFQAMCSKELGADQVWAWPSAEVAVMGAEGASEIVYGKEIQKSDDPEAVKTAKVEEYRKKFANPYDVAERMHIDAVIDPRQTRQHLKRTLRLLAHKDEKSQPKKHGNIPL
ncbi:MAG: acyl-CoA carboxylase subunit beta [Deltaproteobacteria bacterium]|nr:acyl-CoA carboxylase subunit beta [Deltaproteobacteria bacterium]